eukprot:272966-Pyramimonas_sp.AAC.1
MAENVPYLRNGIGAEDGECFSVPDLPERSVLRSHGTGRGRLTSGERPQYCPVLLNDGPR